MWRLYLALKRNREPLIRSIVVAAADHVVTVDVAGEFVLAALGDAHYATQLDSTLLL